MDAKLSKLQLLFSCLLILPHVALLADVNPYSYVACDQVGGHRVCLSKRRSTFQPENQCQEWTVASVTTWALSERLGRVLRAADITEAWVGVIPKRVPWAWISAAFYVLGQPTSRLGKTPVLELDQQGCWADDSSSPLITSRNSGITWQAMANQMKRDLNGPVTFNVSAEACASQCRDFALYNYYGIRRSPDGTVTCFCGETFGNYGPAFDCQPTASSSNLVYRIKGAFSNWAPGQPRGDGCASLSRSQRAWVVDNCFEQRSFICQFPEMSLCEDAQKTGSSNNGKMPRYFRLAGLCFGVVSDSRAMWQDARYTCLAYKGDLPVIMDASTNDLILSVIKDDIWLALTDIAWLTPENAPLTVTFFDQNALSASASLIEPISMVSLTTSSIIKDYEPVIPSPIGRCVAITQTGQWMLRSCTDQLEATFCKSVPVASSQSAHEALQELIFSQVAIPVAIVVVYVALVTILGGAICCFCRRRPLPRHVLEGRNAEINGIRPSLTGSEEEATVPAAASNATTFVTTREIGDAITSQPSRASFSAENGDVASYQGASSMGVIIEQPSAEEDNGHGGVVEEEDEVDEIFEEINEEEAAQENHTYNTSAANQSHRPSLANSVQTNHTAKSRHASSKANSYRSSQQRNSHASVMPRSPSPASMSTGSSNSSNISDDVVENERAEAEIVQTSCCGCYRIGGGTNRNNNRDRPNSRRSSTNSHAVQAPPRRNSRNTAAGQINYTFTEGQTPPQPNNLGDDDETVRSSRRQSGSQETVRRYSSRADDELDGTSGYTSTPGPDKQITPSHMNRNDIASETYGHNRHQSSVTATPLSSAFLTPGETSSSARTSPSEAPIQHEEYTNNTMAIRYSLREQTIESNADSAGNLQSFAVARAQLQGKLGGASRPSTQPLQSQSRVPVPPPPPPPPPPPLPPGHGAASRALEY